MQLEIADDGYDMYLNGVSLLREHTDHGSRLGGIYQNDNGIWFDNPLFWIALIEANRT